MTIYNSRGNQIAIYNCFLQSNQIKSNVGFWREGKTGVPGEKPLIQYRSNVSYHRRALRESRLALRESRRALQESRRALQESRSAR